jgi:hypothetical protein
VVCRNGFGMGFVSFVMRVVCRISAIGLEDTFF